MQQTESRRRGTTFLSLGILAATALAVVSLTGTGSAAPTAVPTNTSPPTVSGSAREGATLTANEGTWTGSPTFAYAWLRCDRDGGSCAAISGATAKTYAVKGVDVQNTLRARVTARNADGSAERTTVPTAVVTASAGGGTGTGANGCPPGNGTAQVGDVALPARLVIDRFQVLPRIVRRSSATIDVRVHVSNTCGQTVAGALVYATAVPFDQFSVEAERTTDSDGMATITMRKLRGFPADRNQRLLVMMLRARKAGENILAGISTRRLVSTPVDLRL